MIKNFKFFTLPEFDDEKGSLVPVELSDYISWEPKRIYFAFDNENTRGGHAHRLENEFFICQKGKITVKLHDGKEWYIEHLNGPRTAVRVDNMVWHEFTDFTDDAILLAVSSTNYDKDDYIRDFDQFLNEKS
jgi:dTDP-4-dehydrorhamnose 3,5-epimerase-like enzyme